MVAYEVALKKTVGAGPRIDVVFACLRVALSVGDIALLKSKLDEAKKYGPLKSDCLLCAVS